MSHWKYNNKPFNPTYQELIDIGWYGFVYKITNLDLNKHYIGKKFFHSKKTLKPLKGRKNKRHRRIESNWRIYSGSSKYVQADIDSGIFTFDHTIISLHNNKVETNYHETKLQFNLNVLESVNIDGSRKFYNENILQRYYPSKKSHDHRHMLHENYNTIEI